MGSTSAAAKAFTASLRSALALDLEYSERPNRIVGTQAAVLLLIAFDERGEASLLMTKRTETVETHKGQMAFPGGMCEPGEDCAKTALRETEEEVGIPANQVEILGSLPELSTVTGFTIAPFVGLLRVALADAKLVPNPHEIADAFWIPFPVLRAEQTYKRELIEAGPIRYPIHVYQVSQHRIWGATGAMIKNLLDRLGALG